MSDAPDGGVKRGFRVRVSSERVALPNGRTLLLDIVRHPGAAAVVPFLSDDEVLLIRQYRHAAGGTILEVPAGKLDAGETPEVCARRELRGRGGPARRAARGARLDLDDARLHRREDLPLRGLRPRAGAAAPRRRRGHRARAHVAPRRARAGVARRDQRRQERAGAAPRRAARWAACGEARRRLRLARSPLGRAPRAGTAGRGARLRGGVRGRRRLHARPSIASATCSTAGPPRPRCWHTPGASRSARSGWCTTGTRPASPRPPRRPSGSHRAGCASSSRSAIARTTSASASRSFPRASGSAGSTRPSTALRGLWRGDAVTLDGRYVQLDGARVRPVPRGGRIPIAIAARGPRMLDLVAAHADSWEVNLPPVASRVREAAAQLAEACRRRGRDPGEIAALAVDLHPGGPRPRRRRGVAGIPAAEPVVRRDSRRGARARRWPWGARRTAAAGSRSWLGSCRSTCP